MPTPHQPPDGPSIIGPGPSSFDRTQVQLTGGVPSSPDACGDEPPRRVDPRCRYRVLRAHAKGGLGIVYVAEDTELHRRVALKEIQLRYADDARSRNRFLLEAEITGRLAHPGIVPVHGLGQYEDGRPYYAMRFVEGETLQDALTRLHATPLRDFKSLEVRTLLHRFGDVCNAVAYAHNQNVIHRDLKPANVLLGRFGETLLIDWGLAKFVGPGGERASSAEPMTEPSASTDARPKIDAAIDPAATWTLPSGDPTQLGAVIGTPGFMPPEQAEGRWNEVGPASDVYSLGATLFALLTGKPALPRPGSETPTPRAINQHVPAALDAICRKAMAPNADARYAHASDLSADVEHWLADEPVTALPEGPAARLGRWARRRLALVTGISTAGLVALVALAFGVWTLTQANEQLRTAAVNEARLRGHAERSTALAVSRDRQTRQAVDGFLTEVSDSPRLLRKEPGTQELRRELLGKAREFYEQFLRERGSDPALQAETASACFRLAVILEELSPGVPALNLYERARSIQAGLVAATPDDPARGEELAQTENHIGALSQRLGNGPKALEAFGRARVLYERLFAQHADRPKVALQFARTLGNLGVARFEAGSSDSALTALDEAHRILVSRTGDADSARELALVLLNRGGILLARGQAGQALDALVAARSAMEPSAAATPVRPDDTQQLARVCNQLANVEVALVRGDPFATYARARDLLDRLARENPGVTEYSQELAATLANVGAAHLRRGDTSAAIEPMRQALGVQDALARTYPKVPSYAQDAARTRNNLGVLQMRLGRRADALRDMTTAVETYAQAVAASHGQNTTAQEYGRFLRNRGVLLAELGRRGDARADLEKSLAIRERLPASPAATADVADTLVALAGVTRDEGDAATSLIGYGKAVELLTAQPAGPARDKVLEAAYLGRAEALARLARPDEARGDWGRAGTTPLARLARAAADARAGNADAVAVAADLSGPGVGGAQLLAAARVYGYAAGKSEDSASKAVALVTRCAASGYLADATWADTLLADDAFAALRDRPAFRAALSAIRLPKPGQ